MAFNHHFGHELINMANTTDINNDNNNNAVMMITPDQSPPTHHLTLHRVKAALQRNHHREQLQRHQNTNRILLAAHETMTRTLHEKDAELHRANRRIALLQNRLAVERMEVSSLRDQLQQHQRHEALVAALADDQEVDNNNDDHEDDEDDSVSDEESESVAADAGSVVCQTSPPEKKDDRRCLKGVCRECEDRMATIVLMPCRHLCLCDRCNEEVAPVPCHICHTIRTGYFQVHLL